MKKMVFGNGQRLSRRNFVVGATAAATGSLALGFNVPFISEAAPIGQAGAVDVNGSGSRSSRTIPA